MNIKTLTKSVITSTLLALSGPSFALDIAVSPIVDFSGWDTMPINNTISLSASGADNLQRVTTDSMAEAFAANVSVNSANCTAFCMARISRNIGTINGSPVYAEVRIGSWEGTPKAVYYSIRIFDTDTQTFVDEVSRGYFGDTNGENWSLGESIGLAMGIEDQVAVFYSGNRAIILEVDLLGQLTPHDAPQPYRLDLYSQEAGDSISATFDGFLDISLDM
ncbi:hypothetical protein [Sedimenticola selenatireducens]|uniref:hypothetical protein n=1 Tax=Sedimenticola selenatireducens TaxID=191960 RepID=UPI00048C2BE3|nr:hypothetical protein [Sedimenticola selenatireducens]